MRAVDAFMTHFPADGSALCAERNTPLNCNRSARKLRHLFDARPSRTIEAKEHIFLEGDPASHLFMVTSGGVCLYRMNADGCRQIVNFAFPRDFVGLESGGVHATSAQATTKCVLKSLSTATLVDAVSHDPDIGLELYETMSRELAAYSERLAMILQRSAAERVAGFLLVCAQRARCSLEQDGIDLEIPMTRRDTADFLDLTIETVSRTLTRLSIDGLIEPAKRSSVVIKDLPGLERIAEGRVY